MGIGDLGFVGGGFVERPHNKKTHKKNQNTKK